MAARDMSRAAELLDAVLQLSMQEDLPSLFDALVDRARSLTGADSSALHLLDPEGKISDPFISDEQVVASTGVPLRAGGQILATLSVAWCRPHRIDPDEIDVLNRLAAHAVPLVKAHARTEAAAADAAALRSALDHVSQEYAELRRFHEADERLLEVAMDDLTLDGLTQAVAAFFGGCVAVFDLDGRQLAVAGRRASMPAAAVIDEAVAYARDHTMPRVAGSVAMVPVHATSQPQAVLIVVAAQPIEALDGRLLYRVSAVATVLITHDVYVNNASELSRMEFFSDVFDIGVDDLHLPRRAASLGLDMRGPVCVACVSSDLPRKRLAEITQAAVQSLGGMAAAYHGTVVAVIPGEDAEQGAREIYDCVVARSNHPTLVAGAGPVHRVGDWGIAQQEALKCLQAMQSLDRQDGAVSMGSLGFIGLVLGRGSDPRRFIDGTIGALIAYDARRSSDLEHTLLTFLDRGSSSVAAAKPLHVHVNTVKQRLDRISEILGPDWREPQRLLEIHLALRLRRVLSS